MCVMAKAALVCVLETVRKVRLTLGLPVLQIIAEREKICLTQAYFRNISRTVESFTNSSNFIRCRLQRRRNPSFNFIFRFFRFLPFSSIFQLKREDTIEHVRF